MTQFLLAAAPVIESGTLGERAQSLLGLVVFVLIAFIIGRLRGAKTFPARVVFPGIALCFVFGALTLYTPDVLVKVQLAIQKLLDFSTAGAQMIFGNLASGRPISVIAASGNAPGEPIGIVQTGFLFGFTVLPTIIFVSLLTAVLYHTGFLTVVVASLAWVMKKTLGTSGAETLSTAANIFVGQTEAPLLVRPFLATATRSELLVVMVGGFSNVATGVLVVYTDLLNNFVPNAGGHLALACFISAPATLVVSKLLMPETEVPETSGRISFRRQKVDANLFDAAARGTTEGMHLALNVGAMLIAFTALIAMLNALTVGVTGLRIEEMLGTLLAPVAWLTGAPWKDCALFGSWLAQKTVLNEFFGYLSMSTALAADPNAVSPRTALLATYGLCGFANFASIGIQIGGISALAPNRRSDLARIGLLAMVGGAIATLMGACVVGVLY